MTRGMDTPQPDDTRTDPDDSAGYREVYVLMGVPPAVAATPHQLDGGGSE